MENTKTIEPDVFLTVPEVAERYRLHVTTISKLCRAGLVGATRAGNGRGRWRIPLAGIEAYSQSRTPNHAQNESALELAITARAEG